MKHIENEFNKFRAKVIHPQAPPVQVREMRAAFYAGCITVLNLLYRHLSKEIEPVQSDIALMESIMDELEAYRNEIRAEASSQPQTIEGKEN